MLKQIKGFFYELDSISRFRIIYLLIFCFLILFSYGIFRPGIESLFLKAHTSKALPNVWIMMSITMIICVAVYNVFLPKVRLIQVYGIISALSGVLFAIMIILEKYDFPGIYYILYIWKDIYIIFLVEIFYTFANSVFQIKKARWLYGFFGASGALGAVIANFSIGPVAKLLGTSATLWIGILSLFLMGVLAIPLAKKADAKIPEDFKKKKANIFEALSIVKKSYYLIFVLLLITTVQLVVTLIDYDFNTIVEALYPVTDIRTGLMGKVYGIVNTLTFVFHAFTGIILRLTGIPFILFAVPFFLMSSLAFFIVLPGFFTVAIIKIASKVFDYTIFRSARECLYIPLSYEERTQGKSIVDIIMYRVGKVGAAILVKILILLGLTQFVSWMTALFILFWIVITFVIVKRFRKLVSRDEEMYHK
ncbi:MAG: Npt1/Npt2 family nucleotide transporter [Pseudomonadota bacterium]